MSFGQGVVGFLPPWKPNPLCGSMNPSVLRFHLRFPTTLSFVASLMMFSPEAQKSHLSSSGPMKMVQRKGAMSGNLTLGHQNSQRGPKIRDFHHAAENQVLLNEGLSKVYQKHF